MKKHSEPLSIGQMLGKSMMIRVRIFQISSSGSFWLKSLSPSSRILLQAPRKYWPPLQHFAQTSPQPHIQVHPLQILPPTNIRTQFSQVLCHFGTRSPSLQFPITSYSFLSETLPEAPLMLAFLPMVPSRQSRVFLTCTSNTSSPLPIT